MEWKAQYALGIAPMDATHREFVDLVSAMSRVENGQAVDLLETFIAHSEAHFDQENQWMQASGFPPVHCHASEHQRVLTTLRSVLGMARRGHPGLIRELAKEMSDWFENHAATMDAALACHLRHVAFAPETSSAFSQRLA